MRLATAGNPGMAYGLRHLASGRRCVASKNEVAIFRRLMAPEARFVQRLVTGLAVGKIREPPTTGRSVFF